MRRAAVAEEAEIELYVLRKSLLLCLCLQDLVAVLTLCARGDLHAAPDEVVALRHAVLVTHMVEGALLGIVIGNEEELVAVFLLGEAGAKALGVRGQVAVLGFGHGVAVALFKLLVEILELNHGERLGGNDDLILFSVQADDLLAVRLLHLGKSVGEQVLLHFHHVVHRIDIGEFKVEARKLGGVLVGIGFLGTEDGAGLKNALQARRHRHLLIELRRLREVGVGIEIFDLKHVGARLGGGADQLGGVDLHEILFEQKFTHSADESGLHLDHQLIFIAAQVDPAVVHTRFNLGIVLNGQGLGYRLDGQLLRHHFSAAETDGGVVLHHAHNRENGVGGDVDYIGQGGFIHGYLNFARGIL